MTWTYLSKCEKNLRNVFIKRKGIRVSLPQFQRWLRSYGSLQVNWYFPFRNDIKLQTNTNLFLLKFCWCYLIVLCLSSPWSHFVDQTEGHDLSTVLNQIIVRDHEWQNSWLPRASSFAQYFYSPIPKVGLVFSNVLAKNYFCWFIKDTCAWHLAHAAKWGVDSVGSSG